ncbi:hypothetical protein EON79_06335 [bacterium]|nr:MAG: hypothetical protein EON79_06335 [bacterium]
MKPDCPAEAVADILGGLNKGQYLVLLQAVRQLGGELRLDWKAIEAAATEPFAQMEVDDTDGPVVIRIVPRT